MKDDEENQLLALPEAFVLLLQKTHWHGWVCRERLDMLGGPVQYPAGLDYEEQEDYAFQQWLKSAAPLSTSGGSGWVSVAERLPEADGEYLVYGNCTNSGESIDIAKFSAYEEGEPRVFHKYNQPTHWRFLPSPPTHAA
jgi:hypothetical protein